MSYSRFGAILAAVLVFGAASFVAGADDANKIDNPRYKAWASFKKGATETLSGKTTVANFELETTITYTLSEVAADHVTVESTTSTTFNGNTVPPNTSTQTIPAKVDKADVKDDGKEDVTAAGKTFHCNVVEIKIPFAGRGGVATDVSAKAWVSTDVPGGEVKMTISAPAGGRGGVAVDREFLLKSFSLTPTTQPAN